MKRGQERPPHCAARFARFREDGLAWPSAAPTSRMPEELRLSAGREASAVSVPPQAHAEFRTAHRHMANPGKKSGRWLKTEKSTALLRPTVSCCFVALFLLSTTSSSWRPRLQPMNLKRQPGAGKPEGGPLGLELESGNRTARTPLALAR